MGPCENTDQTTALKSCLNFYFKISREFKLQNLDQTLCFVCRGVQYVLKIHFFPESGRKMIQFKIQFKTKSKIFIQKNIHSTESIVFNGIIHSKKLKKIFIQQSP